MGSYTYPVARPEGTLTAQQIQLLLANPRVIAKRVQALTDQKFLADYLLTGRFEATGGGIFYETGEEIFASDDPEAIAPGGEYPLTVLATGELAAAKTTKWGLDSEVTDEAIRRLGINPVNSALARLANQTIKYIDSVAWGVIASKVTGTAAAAGAWTSASAIVDSLLQAKASQEDEALGLDRDTVVLSTTQYAKVLGVFVNAGVLPRENGNPIVNGNLPQNLLGFNWVTSPNVTSADPYLIDREQLGGMADEDLGSPGYVRAAGVGIETKSIRGEENDKWRLRARRVTVPVVLEPKAGVRITGTAL